MARKKGEPVDKIAVLIWFSRAENEQLQRMADSELRSKAAMVRIAVIEAAQKRGLNGRHNGEQDTAGLGG